LITLITVIHVFVCVFLILVILLQAGKGGGMGSSLGGGGSQTVFGGRGAQTFLGKVTSVSAGIFMLTSLTLAYNSSKTRSVVDQHVGSVPALPGAPSAPPLPGDAAPMSAPASSQGPAGAPAPTRTPAPAPAPAPAPQK
jgi:preprotein translocase subunit SecG